ncbi:methionine adenosyltransferase [Candidatus Marsarchaeota archaeon]|nr:methionine adenosyltransferase [Candidatus Marsarchaeota archaeon]MCL5099761.1 methionine adenosyltransferase [Candidatus Marsarchaeota archaeon]
MKNIRVSRNSYERLEEQPVEYVERKGLGHPDSLIDGIVERASVELSNAYMDAAGMILHHNVDKGLIIGGSSEARYGYGAITRPIEVILTGRAVQEYQGTRIPVDEIAVHAASSYLKEHTRFLDMEKEVRIESKIVKGSNDLIGIFGKGTDMPLANDTSFGIGFAPFTTTERLVLEAERMLNSKQYKEAMPAVGEDIKIMGVRDGSTIMLTIAVAFVAPLIASADDYASKKERVAQDVAEFARKLVGREVEVAVNVGDHSDDGFVYLTKSGLSCESGDDGSVGRGNRVNGLITPFRHMSLEAAAGKNPVSHVGKIYNVLANEIANDIVNAYPQVTECGVSMVSQIGRPIDDPKHLDIKVNTERPEQADALAGKLSDLAEQSLANIGFLTKEILAGKHSMF